MKIRNGFVSNSSSSSFIVVFPRIPKDVNDLVDILFDKNQKEYSNPYHYGNDEVGWPVNTVAETIWLDIQNQKYNDFERAKDMISSGSIDEPGAPEYNYSNRDKYANEMKIFTDRKMKELFNIRKLKLKKINKQMSDNDVVFYCFNYGDNDGSYYLALEHGDIFHKLKHIRISNH